MFILQQDKKQLHYICIFLRFRAAKLAMTLETFSARNTFDSIERLAHEDSFCWPRVEHRQFLTSFSFKKERSPSQLLPKIDK